MKKTLQLPFLCFALVALQFVIVSCSEEDDSPYSGKIYKWEKTLPYDYANTEIKPSWIGGDVHSDSQYDSVLHRMNIIFRSSDNIYIDEVFEAVYTHAYRYIGTTDTDNLARVFCYYPENWERFDTNYTVSVSKRVSANSNGGYPDMLYRLDGIYISQSVYIGSTPDFDQRFIPWDSGFLYPCHFQSEDTIEFSFPVKIGDVVRDTIVRTFIIQR